MAKGALLAPQERKLLPSITENQLQDGMDNDMTIRLRVYGSCRGYTSCCNHKDAKQNPQP